MTRSWTKQALRDWHPWGVESPPPARPLRQLLPDALQKLGLNQRLWESQITEHWVEIVGAYNATICQPFSLKRGCLTVVVNHPAYIQELRPHKDLLLAKVQARVGKICVRQISFRVGLM